MKAYSMLITLFLSFFVVFIFSGQALSADNLKSEALQDLKRSFVKALPAKSDIVRLGVLDFEGDDGTVKNAITSALTEKTDFRVIERSDLDKILKEQGLQLKDILDEKTRVQHGKIKGVQGILFGKVIAMESGFMSYTIKIHVKLDDVERAEVLLSKDISVTAVSPIRQWVMYGVLAIITILIVFSLWKKKQKVDIEKAVKQDVVARIDLVKEVNRALTNITEAKAKLMEKGMTDDAIMLKDAERDIRLLKEHVDNAARGSMYASGAKDFKQTLEFDKAIMESFRELTQSADRVYSLVVSGDLSALSRDVDYLKRDIKNTINEFSKRGM